MSRFAQTISKAGAPKRWSTHTWAFEFFKAVEAKVISRKLRFSPRDDRVSSALYSPGRA